MPTALRWLASIAVVALAAVLLHCFVWVPVTCSRQTARVIVNSQAAMKGSTYRAAVIARTNLELLRGCSGACAAADVDTAMARALNLRLVGRTQDSLRVYREALVHSRRPELYLNFGHALLESGDREGAFKALRQACMFAPTMVSEIDDGDLKQRVLDAVAERDARIRAGKASE